MKKLSEREKEGQLKIDFPSIDTKKLLQAGKIININSHSKKLFTAYILRNSKSF